ncbi:TPA: molecular chaperone, partial [Klebsiella quasipneumoniae subsp. quasipneumoniae]|nr:molecular chaperone [Klebsiella quasipneumoniae subsp. quasipneumoniae]
MKCIQTPAWLMFSFILFTFSANASVVMTGTRIIFPSTAIEKTIQLRNQDSHPYVVQLQMTKENGEPDNSAPFSLVPPVFRMEASTGQSARLIYTGKPLPQNKESVFYLDFVQLPAIRASQKNQLIIAVRNRVKVFYRPVSLAGSPGEAYQSLVFTLNQGNLKVENPTGFNISIRKATLDINGKTLTLRESTMLSPK